ncbi:MAG TPA: peptidylprolyl isomerase [Caulobacteraceae bacterium]|nr:peptidylprolyl isomerase [Caulobacteraceae bacterium]
MRHVRPLAVLATALALAGCATLERPAAPEPSAAEWRMVDPENLLVIDTTKGRMLVEMTPVAAPLHVAQIKALARRGFYDGVVFHRVIDWFMSQTGDPTGTGEGGSDLPDVKAEFTFRRGADVDFVPVAKPYGAQVGFIGALPVQTQPDELMAKNSSGTVAAWGLYCPGVAGMARGEPENSANSQFFFMRHPYPSLEKRYTVWGRVVDGLEVVRAIKTGEPVVEPDRMTRVRVAADLPEAERPVLRTLNPRSRAFEAMVARVRKEKGADFSACDIAVPYNVSGGGA